MMNSCRSQDQNRTKSYPEFAPTADPPVYQRDPMSIVYGSGWVLLRFCMRVTACAESIEAGAKRQFPAIPV
jgi:hypothetical protein